MQPERTALSWRRTALALTIGPLVVARLLAPGLEVGAVAVAALGTACGLGLLAASIARYRRVHEVLTGRPAPGRRPGFVPRAVMPGGRLLLLTALLPTAGGLVALAVALGRL
nr:DUF202 domain-containing protein [Cellulomonas sp. APG4]